MTEKELRELKLNESIRTENGERYTRTVGGWIYSNFNGQLLFIPDVAKSATTDFEENVVKKEVATKKTK